MNKILHRFSIVWNWICINKILNEVNSICNPFWITSRDMFFFYKRFNDTTIDPAPVIPTLNIFIFNLVRPSQHMFANSHYPTMSTNNFSLGGRPAERRLLQSFSSVRDESLLITGSLLTRSVGMGALIWCPNSADISLLPADQPTNNKSVRR